MKAKDEKILAALLSCPTIRAASEACGVSESQIYSRLRVPEFKARYDEARGQLLKEATEALRGHLAGAVETMGELCRGADVPAQTRLNASTAIIQNFLKLHERVDVEQRLTELEKAANDPFNIF